LALFDGTNGANPCTPLIQGKDGFLYGSTECDGLADYATNNPNGHGFGTIYKMSTNGALDTLVIFNGTNGIESDALIEAKDGNLYGTTRYGGTTYSVTNDPYYGPLIVNGHGTIFRISKSGKFSTLVSFNGTNGSEPGTIILGKDGNIYGFTAKGGAFNNGTFFELNQKGQMTTLHSFTGKNEDGKIGNLTLSTDGSFYGTSGDGGEFNMGRIFHLTVNPR
jgi:uncharacterized repeat protein (TIGR03803 family)